MNYNIKINEVNNENSAVKAFATVVFGDSIAVRNIAVVAKKDGDDVFISMPSKKTGEVDEYNSPVYRDICNPITVDFQKELSGAIKDAYNRKKAKKLDSDGLTVGEGEGMPKLKVRVTPFEIGDGSLLGFASIYLDDSFVISNVSIVNGRNGEFVSMPAYKTSTRARNGETSYRDIAYPITKECRELINNEILAEYHEQKEKMLSAGSSKDGSARDNATKDRADVSPKDAEYIEVPEGLEEIPFR